MPYSFAPVNGTQIHYESRGRGEALILLHAGINNLRLWDEQMEPFARHYQVVRYDLREWGETVQPPGVYSDHDDLRGLLDYLGIETAVLLGLSHGGAVALDFALAYPQRVSRLILCGSGLSGYEFTSAGIAAARQAMVAAYDAGDIDGAVEWSVQIWLDGMGRGPEDVDPQVRRRAAELTRHTFLLPEGAGARQALSPPASERLEAIDVPALVLVGEYDVPDIQAIAAILAERLPQATRVDFPGAAHLPNMEQPALFNQIVLDFLRPAGDGPDMGSGGR